MSRIFKPSIAGSVPFICSGVDPLQLLKTKLERNRTPEAALSMQKTKLRTTRTPWVCSAFKAHLDSETIFHFSSVVVRLILSCWSCRCMIELITHLTGQSSTQASCQTRCGFLSAYACHGCLVPGSSNSKPCALYPSTPVLKSPNSNPLTLDSKAKLCKP